MEEKKAPITPQTPTNRPRNIINFNMKLQLAINVNQLYIQIHYQSNLNLLT